MRIKIGADDLARLGREVGPPPPPVEPVLGAAQEAALIASDRGADPTVPARRARVLRLLRRPATPKGADAELIALLADARALPLERRDDWVSARQRLAGIGSAADPPPEVLRLMAKHRVTPSDGAAFADALLRGSKTKTTPFHEGDFGSNPSPD